jgi:hypothetical protein
MGPRGGVETQRQVRAGGAVDISSFSNSGRGDANLFMLDPWPGLPSISIPGAPRSIRSDRFLRDVPHRAGSGGGGTSPDWDPFWRAGIRWDLSLGAPWRAALGLDLESVMSEDKTGDTFRLVLAVSREVNL